MREKRFAYALYCLGPKHLPVSYRMKSASKIRSWFARRIMASAGKHINIERGASFTENTSIGSNSCIGINYRIQEGKVVIGNNVLMGPDVLIFTTNHESARTDIPICMQGNTESKPVVIEDDVWIGARVIILPGVTVRRGCIVGAGTVLTKTFPEYSVIAGNPGKVVKNRLDNEKNELEIRKQEE